MEINTLENASLSQLLKGFNTAFSDYMIKLQLTEQQLIDKMESEGTELKYSVGMFDNDELVGFILHAYDEIDGVKMIYNGGTGVAPAYRGKGITQQLYKYIIDKLKAEGINHHLLEFLTGNHFVQRVYENVGFTIVRELDCLRGKVEGNSGNSAEIHFKELTEPDWQLLKTFFTIQPSWQNNISSVKRAKNKRKTVGVFKADQLIGFTSFNPENGRIALLAIDPTYRKQGYGTALLNYVQRLVEGEVSVFNIDVVDKEIYTFFVKRGLQSVVGQFEMKLEIE